MSDFRGYFYIEALSLTAAQRDTLIDGLRQLGRNESDFPHERNHRRVRLDGQAVIFEAVFDDTMLTAVAIRARLAALFGVSNTSITYATTQTVYGPVVTYSYNSIQRLRMGVFGGVSASWAESRTAAAQFLADNRAAWEAGL